MRLLSWVLCQTNAEGSKRNHMRKRAKQLTAFLLSLILMAQFIPAPPAMAAPPAATASQITLTLADGSNDGTSAVTFNWVMDTTVNTSELVYGTDSELDDGTTTVSTVMTAPSAEDILPEGGQEFFKEVHTFHATADNLEPGVTYYYKIGSADGGYTEPRAFQAPNAPEDNAPFSFVVSADTQGEDEGDFENTAELYRYIAETEPDAAFLVHTGDLVEDGYSSDQWQYFYEAAQPLLDTMPIMAVPGNHDGGSHDENTVNYNARLNYDTLTAPEGLSDETEGTVYSFTYGDVQFVALNTNAGGDDDEIQYRFLQEQMDNTDKAWKIVIMHEPAYDPGSSHYSFDNEVGAKLTAADVDLVLCGHEHGYARNTFYTTSDGAQAVAPGEGPTYIIGGSVYDYAYGMNPQAEEWSQVFVDLRADKTGSGGGSIYSPGVYAKVDVTSNSLTYTAYYKATGEENDFQVIDTFTIQKSGEEVTQPIGGGTEPDGVTYLWDSFEQENGKLSARFNWTTDVETETGILYYAKKADFDANGGLFTHVALADSEVVDLSGALSDAGYTGGTADYKSVGEADYCYAPVMSHKAETIALEPDTEYVYCVGDGGMNTTSVSAPAVIKTPAADEDTFEFLFFTDAQQGACGSYDATVEAYEDFGTMLEGAVEQYPDAAFILSGGDQVNYTFDTWQWDAFFEQGKDVFEQYPLYLSAGNHECDGAGNEWAPGSSWDPVDISISSLKGRYNLPENGVAYYGGGDGTQRMASGTEKLESMAGNYFFVYGDTLFLVLDFQDSTQSGLTDLQQEWVKSVVKQNQTRWRVAVLHKTLFGYRVDDPTEGDYGNWSDTFDEAGIDLVLMGHDHVYTRTNYYAQRGQVNNSTDPGSGTTYITGASANTDNRSDYYEESPYVLVHSTTDFGRSYLAVSVSPEALKVSVHGIENGAPKTVENEAVITTIPRTYDLSDWEYPEVPEEEDDLLITQVTVNGIAKEGQTLRAEVEPGSATVSYVWERSQDMSVWTAIDGADGASYTVQAADVGCYLRCVATGTGFYHGTAESDPTAKATSLAGGGQTVQISSVADLQAMVEQFGSEDYPIDAAYELTGELDMTGITIAPIGGAEDTPLLGTFNGKGFAIKNLTIEGAEGHSAGLFAYVGSTGHVANVVLTGVTVTGSGGSTGGIAGASEGLIENCSVTGTVSGDGDIGGAVGILHGGTLQNCLVNTSVSGNPSGGLIGGTNFGGPIASKNEEIPNIIRNNLVLGTVTGENYSGAFVGDMGGSSGAILQTCTGNAVNNTVDADRDNLLAGYWSGSRPIEDETSLNYAVDTLILEGMNAGTDAFDSRPAADFAAKALYEELGWDFETVWTWNESNNLPEPQVIEISTGDDLVTIIATAGRGGSIQPEGYTLVTRGEDQTFTFAADEYYEIDTGTIDGVSNTEAAAAGSYTFENVTALHIIDVTFRLSDEVSGRAPSLVSTSAYYNRTQEKHIDLTVVEQPVHTLTVEGGTISAAGVETGASESAVAEQTAVTVTAVIPEGQQFSRWEVTGLEGVDLNTNPLIFTMPQGDVTATAVFRTQSSSSGGSSSGSRTETVTNPDGSTTITVTRPNGTVTETTTDTEGNRIQTVLYPNGSGETTITKIDGSSSTSTVSESGRVEVVVELPAAVVNEAAEAGQTVALPMPEVPVTTDRENAPTVTVDLPADTTAKVEIPVEDVTPGTVAVLVHADGTEEVLNASVTTENGVVLPVKDGETVKIVDNTKTFSDVPAGFWGADAVAFAASRELFTGTSANTFAPEGRMTRAMIVTVLARYEGVDTTSGELWYTEGAQWAVNNGISDGTNLDAAVTREQLVTMLYRYAGEPAATGSASSFTDGDDVSSWAADAMSWAIGACLVGGVGNNTLNPQGTATRAEVATILMRFISNLD